MSRTNPVVDAFFDGLFDAVSAPGRSRRPTATPAKPAPKPHAKRAPAPRQPPKVSTAAPKPRKRKREPAEAPAAAQIADPERLLFAASPSTPELPSAPEPEPESVKVAPSQPVERPSAFPQVALRENETVARTSAGGVVIRRARG